MNRIGNKWSDEEEARLIAALERGKSLEQIAQDHQRTTKAIEMRIENLIRKAPKSVSAVDLAERFHISEEKVREIRAAPFITPSPRASEGASQEMNQKLDRILARLSIIEKLLEKNYKRVKSLENK